jgi:hypothetical protein
MALSNDLISQFVKVTNDNSDSKKETIVYGTATEHDGSMYVKIDGSELLTPISTTADVKNGERVTVMIKNHNAIITGNISSPAARTGTVGEVNYSLRALTARIDKLVADTITTDNLSAINASIKNLDADVADINTLIFGSATGDTVQTSFANTIIAQLGDAQIKSAMIQDISASKLKAGDIITNNVRIKSEDGSLIISDETMQISDDTRVRVQIGKDAFNDYSINIWDADGELMFSQGGITDHAIKDAIIRNDMVSENANISASKLDIDSLFEEINKDGSNTIKSTRVYLDDEKQTLDLAFKGLTATVNDLGETVSSQGTQISAVQGQISSKVWQQDINTAKNEMSTKYSTLNQEVDGISATVSSNTSKIGDVESAIATLELTADGLTTKVNAAKKQLYHSASGTSGTTGYVGFCSIRVGGSYQNRPILFELNNRGRQASNVSFCFENVNSSDPIVNHLEYDGGIKVWAYKTGASNWTLIADKSEGYDTIYVKDFANNNGATVITWTNVHYSELPTGNITAGTKLAGKLTKATVDNAAKTATNYLNFSTAGLVIGDLTASTLGKNVLIDSDSVDIRNGTTTLASFGADYLYLSKNSRNATIDLCNGLAKLYHQSKYSYDTLFVIDTPNATEIQGTYNPLCVTSTVSGKVSIQFANTSGVIGSIGMVESGTESYITRNHPSTAATYSILDTGNFYKLMDSGWVNCTLNTGSFTRYNNNIPQPQVRKIGKQVYLRGEAKPVTAVTPASDSDTVIATIPSGYRPSERQQFVMQGSGAYRWMMSIHTDGRIAISRYTNGTTANMNIAAGTWLCCHAQWLID